MNTWSHLESEAMVGTWKDARVSGHCLASACDDTGNSATLGDSSTDWVDMCGLDDLRCEQRLLNSTLPLLDPRKPEDSHNPMMRM